MFYAPATTSGGGQPGDNRVDPRSLAGLARQLTVSSGGYGWGGGVARAGSGYYPHQANYGAGDALTVAGHPGPVRNAGYGGPAGAGGRSLALYNTPGQHAGVSAQPEPRYHVAYHPRRRAAHRARYAHARRVRHPPGEQFFDGRAAALPAATAADYVPLPGGQAPGAAPAYVPAYRAAGAPAGAAAGYSAVPLPE